MSFHLKTVKKGVAVIFISGLSNSGKTTLIERLIPKLRERGLRVGTVKHAPHGCDLDRRGKDSWRHTQAGACAVTLMSPKQMASFIQTQQEMDLAQVIGQMSRYVDLILVEGYKEADGQKIVLEPAGAKSLQIEDGRCQIGVPPERLSQDEMEQITAFVLAYVTRRL